MATNTDDACKICDEKKILVWYLCQIRCMTEIPICVDCFEKLIKEAINERNQR